MVEITAHFDGKQIVLDEPFELPTGARLKLSVIESESERKTRILDAIAAFGTIGAGGHNIEDRYLDDRETYYDDDHRAGLD